MNVINQDEMEVASLFEVSDDDMLDSEGCDASPDPGDSEGCDYDSDWGSGGGVAADELAGREVGGVTGSDGDGSDESDIAFRERMDSIAVFTQDVTTSNVKLIFSIGMTLRFLKDSGVEASADSLKPLARFLDCPVNEVLRFERMPLFFSYSEAMIVFSRPMKNGQFMNRRHLIAFMSIHDKTIMSSVVKRCLEESWPAETLESKIRIYGFDPSVEGEVTDRLSPSGFLDEMREMEAKISSWKKSFFGFLEESPVEEYKDGKMSFMPDIEVGVESLYLMSKELLYCMAASIVRYNRMIDMDHINIPQCDVLRSLLNKHRV